MASLQTQVFVNNEWVTETVSTEELFRAHTRPTAPTPTKPPNYGVLTRTLIKSPIVRWVLPAQLRSPRFNDVALVGDRHVQICELTSDFQLQPIANMDFPCRIANCRVMGTPDYLRRMKEDIHANYYRSGNDNTTSSRFSTPSIPFGGAELFQQVLLLVLTTGELEFVIMRLAAAGDWEFILSHFPVTDGRGGRLLDPILHVAISPDGGYLTLAYSENLLVVCQLESIEGLHRQHAGGNFLRPIRSMKARALKGVIHKLDFLYPGSRNVSHVVLLVIVVRSGVFRLAVYEWEDWNSLEGALAKETPGHRLDGTTGPPVLIIPLTVDFQFLMITEHSMAICSDIFSGPPVFSPFELANKGKTEWHHGTHQPIWTAWARPLREETYHADSDLIYLAREDGWINSLEIGPDSDILASIYMGPLECNINSGFASLSTTGGEILVAGGDYGPGAIWRLDPRKNPKRIGSLPNWSPTIGLALTNSRSGHSKSDHRTPPKQSPLSEKPRNHMLTPEKIFVCSGRDKSGAIVELRYGIQAKIGLDLLYPSPIKRCWAIPSFDDASEEGFFMLLALPENSALLYISQDFSQVSEKPQDSVDFDLLSTTLAVHISEDFVVQITTARATIMSPISCYQHSINDIVDDPLAIITDAATTAETLALSVYSQSIFKIMVFTFDKTKFTLAHTFNDPDGDVTALSLNTLSVGVCVLAGISYKDYSALVIFPLDSPDHGRQTLSNTRRETLKLHIKGDDGSSSPGTHAVTSIVCLGDDKIIVGKRDGDVLTIRLLDDHQTGRRLIVTRTNHFGISPSWVFPGTVLDTRPSTLVCNDAGLISMKEADEQSVVGCFEEISQVWLTDANEPHSPSPAINSVANLNHIQGYGDSTWVMVAGSNILITELQSHPGPVPRYIPTEGTPLEILYSERLGALVTVIKKNGIPSLHFFDPVTGGDLSRPIEKGSDQGHEQPIDIEYIEPLGNSNTTVTFLMNWRCKYGGKRYEWFVILARYGDSDGRVLIVSAEKEKDVINAGTSPRIRFWSQFHRRIKDELPRFGATDDEGLFLNYGQRLEYHVIQDKKFKTARTYDLPSPATHLEVIDGYLHVLTSHHSLAIFDYKSETAVNSGRMVPVRTDAVARNALHSIDVGLPLDTKEQQKLILVSDPMCCVYGLWSSDRSSDASTLQLVFMADLAVSIQKFVSGHTRPRWARDQPRYACRRILSREQDILGLGIGGSLTQFSVLDEDTWRLLRYVQIRTIASADIRLDKAENSSIEDTQLDPSSLIRAKMHVDGDVLQRCYEKRMLEHLVTTEEEIAQLQKLLAPLGLSPETSACQMLDEASLAYDQTYSVLEYFLSPAL